MDDALELFRPLCNGAVRAETRTEKLTGDAGFLLLREALDRTALIDHLAARLEDPRDGAGSRTVCRRCCAPA
jgi:hypothetical protein